MIVLVYFSHCVVWMLFVSHNGISSPLKEVIFLSLIFLSCDLHDLSIYFLIKKLLSNGGVLQDRYCLIHYYYVGSMTIK